jgi:UDP-galactopyranose mutase
MFLQLHHIKTPTYLKLLSDKIVFTGMIDEYYDYCYGELEYRGLDFEFETLDIENYQGNAVINYTDAETPYTISLSINTLKAVKVKKQL